MIKTAFTILAVSSLLLMGGCDNEQARRMEEQQDEAIEESRQRLFEEAEKINAPDTPPGGTLDTTQKPPVPH